MQHQAENRLSLCWADKASEVSPADQSRSQGSRTMWMQSLVGHLPVTACRGVTSRMASVTPGVSRNAAVMLQPGCRVMVWELTASFW